MQKLTAVGTSLCLLVLVNINTTLTKVQIKMDEVLTNAAECGDLDCDDGYSYALSRQRLKERLELIHDDWQEPATQYKEVEL